MSTLLEVFGIDWRLLLLQTANFGILVAALTILLYKPVMKIVRERAQVVAKGVEDAEAAAAHLAAADSEAGARLGTADREAGEIVKRARTEASAEKAVLLKEAEERAVEIAKDAEARAAHEAARVRRESEKEIARFALLAAEKLMRKKI